MLIIPAIDIIDGKCVRLSKGDFSTKKEYSASPVTVAKVFEDAGITHLHLVDLDGARSGKVVNWHVLEEIASQTNLSIDFSGGIKGGEDIQRALQLGATQITVGSMAVKYPEDVIAWIESFTDSTLIIGADTIDGYIAVHGWQESSTQSIDDFISFYYENGAKNFLCTDVACDGMLQGPSIGLYTEILKKHPHISLIASGGVSCIEDLYNLHSINCYAAIVGKAYYEGRISLQELSAIQSFG